MNTSSAKDCLRLLCRFQWAYLGVLRCCCLYQNFIIGNIQKSTTHFGQGRRENLSYINENRSYFLKLFQAFFKYLWKLCFLIATRLQIRSINLHKSFAIYGDYIQVLISKKSRLLKQNFKKTFFKKIFEA